MSTEPAQETDLATLVGEMEEIPCEHSQHWKNRSVHDGPATHYVRGTCPSCGRCGQIYAACAPWVAAIQTGHDVKCSDCDYIGEAWEMVKVLGPVGSNNS